MEEDSHGRGRNKIQETGDPTENRGRKISRMKRISRRTAGPGAQSPDLSRKVEDSRRKVWGREREGFVSYLLKGMD